MNFLPPAALPALVPRWPRAASFGLRPEDVSRVTESPALLTGQVTLCERLGEVTVVHVVLADGTGLMAKLPGSIAVTRGETIGLSADPGRVHAFDADGIALPRA